MSRSIAYSIAFFLWTIVMNFAWLPALLGPARWTVAGQRFWANGVVWLMARVAGISVDIRGRENLAEGGVIVASRHQSTWETLIYHRILDDPAVVMKQELLSIPIYGWYSQKARMIPIDRRGGARSLRAMLRAARQARDAGRPIVIFPEGTRIPVDAEPTLLPGVAALYRDLDVPVVPVALNSGLFWPRHGISKHPGNLVLEFLPAIPPGLERKPFMAELEERLNDGTRALVAEGKGL